MLPSCQGVLRERLDLTASPLRRLLNSWLLKIQWLSGRQSCEPPDWIRPSKVANEMNADKIAAVAGTLGLVHGGFSHAEETHQTQMGAKGDGQHAGLGQPGSHCDGWRTSAFGRPKALGIQLRETSRHAKGGDCCRRRKRPLTGLPGSRRRLLRMEKVGGEPAMEIRAWPTGKSNLPEISRIPVGHRRTLRCSVSGSTHAGNRPWEA